MTSPQGISAAFFQPAITPLPDAENPPQGGLTAGCDGRLVRKPSNFEGSSLFDTSASLKFFHENQVALHDDLTRLRKFYGFPADDSVANFLSNHRDISIVLLSAEPKLKQYFGANSILKLEVSADDDDSQTLYAVVVWRGAVATAAQALDDFSEHWWLDRMTASTSDLSFTYEIF